MCASLLQVKDDQIQKLEDQLRQVREEARREVEKIKEASAEQVRNRLGVAESL